MADVVRKPEDEWRQTLTPEQYEVLRKKGTERAFTGQYWDNHERGVYRCAFVPRGNGRLAGRVERLHRLPHGVDAIGEKIAD